MEAKSLVFTASNPTVEQLFQVWRETTAFAPEVVVAIGGGSVLDVGKSLCCLYGRELESLQALREAITDGKLHPAAQWIGVPTTAGTGSEVTCWATIWDPEQACKRSLESQENYAYAALVDPELALGMPGAAGGVLRPGRCRPCGGELLGQPHQCCVPGPGFGGHRHGNGGIDGLLENAPAAHEAMARGSLLAGWHLATPRPPPVIPSPTP